MGSNPFQNLALQPRVQHYFEHAYTHAKLAQSYLFVGTKGSLQEVAAHDLAFALLQTEDDATNAEILHLIQKGTHPDVTEIKPKSQVGYLIAQMREIVDTVHLTPLKGAMRIIIIHDADKLLTSSANMILKTLEEPPAHVAFVLLAPSVDSVITTIVSRCQIIPFLPLSDKLAIQEIVARTGAPELIAAVAYDMYRSIDEACQYVANPYAQKLRSFVIEMLEHVVCGHTSQILADVMELLFLVDKPFLELKEEQKQQTKEQMSRIKKKEVLSEQASSDIIADEFLSRGAKRELELSIKREDTLAHRAYYFEAVHATQSILRDVLIFHEIDSEHVINKDALSVITKIEAVSTGSIETALLAAFNAEQALMKQLTPRLVFEVLFLEVKEALHADRFAG